ncbi:MAG: holo-ACP synthase [Gammaproteobacteria bacterium]|nr:MAG: holo-ACP synthase [Gammaproteobacteria bacterium]
MIAGIGTDIVAIARMARLYERHGQRAVDKLLAINERRDFASSRHPERFLAKRFAAKEAFAKALGTGFVSPVTLANIGITHDARGRPLFEYAPPLAAYLAECGFVAQLSISDEHDVAIAFVVLERLG